MVQIQYRPQSQTAIRVGGRTGMPEAQVPQACERSSVSVPPGEVEDLFGRGELVL